MQLRSFSEWGLEQWIMAGLLALGAVAYVLELVLSARPRRKG